MDAQRGQELQYGLFNYFPDAHYRKAIKQAATEEIDDQVLTDGGQLHKGDRRAKLYYWVDPSTDAALVHTEVNEDGAIPFFDSVGSAEAFLERRDDADDSRDYETASLYQARVKKVKDAKDVLLDQAGIDDFEQFSTDGGYELGGEDTVSNRGERVDSLEEERE